MAAAVSAADRARRPGVAERFQTFGKRALERLRDISQRLPGLRQQSGPQNQLGLALLPNGISLASTLRIGSGQPRLVRCEFQPLPRQADPGLSLRNLMLQTGLERASLQLVLNPDEYQLHLVESPDVPDSEMRDAVRWRIRDLIDFPVDEAAIDVFDMPQAGAGRETGKMMCVVVSRTPVIAQKAALVNRSGAELGLIDIADLSLRNLLALTPADRTGAALLYVEAGYSMILITGDETLYLSRRIWIGQQELAALADKDPLGEEFRRTADALAMELLRSLEYYETHFSRPAVETLYVAPFGLVEPALLKHLSQAVGVSAEALDLNKLLDIPGGMAPDMQARSLLAIGAALRQERVAL